MASQYDLVHLIGGKTCAAASTLTELLASSPACTNGQTWNMGLLVMATVVVLLAAKFLADRRIRYRETYFR